MPCLEQNRPSEGEVSRTNQGSVGCLCCRGHDLHWAWNPAKLNLILGFFASKLTLGLHSLLLLERNRRAALGGCCRNVAREQWARLIELCAPVQCDHDREEERRRLLQSLPNLSVGATPVFVLAESQHSRNSLVQGLLTASCIPGRKMLLGCQCMHKCKAIEMEGLCSSQGMRS